MISHYWIYIKVITKFMKEALTFEQKEMGKITIIDG